MLALVSESLKGFKSSLFLPLSYLLSSFRKKYIHGMTLENLKNYSLVSRKKKTEKMFTVYFYEIVLTSFVFHERIISYGHFS